MEGRQDLGDYKGSQLKLARADYIANSSGDKLRAEIKEKMGMGGGSFYKLTWDKGIFRLV